MSTERREIQDQVFGSKLGRRALLGGTAALVASALLAACGGDDDDTDGTDEPAGDSATSTVSTPSEPSPTTGATAAQEDTPESEDGAETPETGGQDGTPESGGEDEEERAGQLREFENPEPGPPVGDKPDELVIAYGLSQFTGHGVDPQLHCGSIAESQLRHIYEPLVAYSRDLQTIEPLLATEWERIDDLTMQFKLREGVKFHNGEEFTAEAVRFSVLRPLSDETPGDCRSIWANIDDVEIIDDYTVNIKTKAPDPALLARMAGIHMNIVAPEWAAQGTETVSMEAIGGTGPYKFVSWSPNEDLVVEANEEYWGEVPSIKRVRMVTISEQATRVAALRSGEVHIAKDVPPEEIDGINESGRARVLRTAQARVPFYFITTEVEPFNDPRVRQAINYAANVDGVIESILLGNGQRLSTIVATWDFAFDPTLEPYPDDPERAKELLAEAGYPDGIDLQIWYIQGRYPKDKEVAEAMCQQMGRANIRCTPELRESAVLTEMQMAKETPGLVFASWGNIWFDPDFSIEPLFGCQPAADFGDWRRPYGCNEELEEVLQAARVELDVDRRRELFEEAQRLIYDDAAALFMYQVVDIWGVNNWVKWQPRGDEKALAYEMEWNE